MFGKKIKEDVKSILFVCTGNICRSPIAEFVARREMEKRGLELKLDSAGTGGWHEGEKACENSILIAKRNGIDLSTHRARQLVRDDKEYFDLIVIMDRRNAMDAKAFGIKGAVKLGKFALGGAEIPDPYYYTDLDEFQKVYEMIDSAVVAMFDELFGKKQ